MLLGRAKKRKDEMIKSLHWPWCKRLAITTNIEGSIPASTASDFFSKHGFPTPYSALRYRLSDGKHGLFLCGGIEKK